MRSPCERIEARMNAEARKIIRALSPDQKLKAAERLYRSAQQLKAASLRARHPDWTEEAILRAVREVFLHSRS